MGSIEERREWARLRGEGVDGWFDRHIGMRMEAGMMIRDMVREKEGMGRGGI